MPPLIDPVERAHMAWDCAVLDGQPMIVSKDLWVRIVSGVAAQAAAAEREACARIADRCADDETRTALGANATINASQIAAAIRSRR